MCMAKDKRVDKHLSDILMPLMSDVDKINAELSAQLDVLSRTIDASFKNMSQVASNSIKVSHHFLTMGMPKLSLFTLGAGVACAFAGGAYIGYTAAKHHNRILDNLQAQKTRIANEKGESTHRLLQRSRLVCKRVEQLVDKELSQSYSIVDFKKARKQKWANMLQLMMLYKVSLNQSLTLQYLFLEYEAWANGRQTSDANRPTFLDVNDLIIGKLSGGKSGENLLRRIQNNDADDIASGEVYCMSDPQLASRLLVGMYFDERNHTIEKLKWPIEQFRKKMLKRNIAYKLYKRNRRAMKWNAVVNRLLTVFAHPLILGPAIIALTAVLMLLLFQWLDWYAWIEWTIGIVVVLLTTLVFIAVAVVSEYYSKMKKNKAKSKEKAYYNCWRRMAFLSGWVEYIKPNLERKTPIFSAIGGVLKLLDN